MDTLKAKIASAVTLVILSAAGSMVHSMAHSEWVEWNGVFSVLGVVSLTVVCAKLLTHFFSYTTRGYGF